MQTTARSVTEYHLRPQSHGWKLTCDDPSGGVTTFPSLPEAMQTARDLAHENAPSRVRMYSEFGELIRDWHFGQPSATVTDGHHEMAGHH